MSDTSLPFCGGQSNRTTVESPSLTQHQYGLPFHGNLAGESDIESTFQQLVHNENFTHYTSIIQAYLFADNEDWEAILYLRELPTPRSALWRQFHGTIHSNPPPDIFDLVRKMRQSAFWNTDKHTILIRFTSAQRLNSAPPAIQRDSAPLAWPSSASATRPHTQQSHSHSRSAQSSFARSGSCLHQDFNPATESINGGGDNRSASAKDRRTAPPGMVYWCLVPFCDRHFSRPGDLENHHEEVHFIPPKHHLLDLQKHLGRAPRNNKRKSKARNAQATASGCTTPSTRSAIAADFTPDSGISHGTAPGNTRPGLPTPSSAGQDVVQTAGLSPGLSMPTLANESPTALNANSFDEYSLNQFNHLTRFGHN